MEKKTLNVVLREERKKRAAGRLKRAGKIPAILYGHGEPLALTVDAHEFHKKFTTVSENTLINLRTGENDYDVLVKDYQSDILSGKVTHLDFYEVEKGKLLRTHVPVHLTGTAIGVREGGLLEHLLHEVEVECLPRDIPELISVDIENLAVGDAVHISQLQQFEGVKILNHEDQVVVLIAHHKAVVEAEPTEEVEEEGVEEEEKAESEKKEG